MEETSLFDDFNGVSHQEWKEKIIADLKGKSFEETLIWKDESGIIHQPYYNRESNNQASLLEEIQALQPKNNDWKIIQEINFKNKVSKKYFEKANRNGIDEFVIHGAKSFKKGKKINYYLSDIQKEKLPTHILVDPIGELIKKDGPANSIDSLIPIFKKKLNDLNLNGFLLIDGGIYKNAGATIVEELALSLHHAFEYLDKLTEVGFTPEAIARSFIFKLDFGTSYFTEIAKGRAYRYLLHKLLSAYQTTINPTIWGAASPYYLAHTDAHTNLLRTTSQCMSAILANCNYISVPPFDEHAPQGSLGLRMAKNIPLILKEESFFNQVKDISAGSYYLEELTIKLVEKSWDKFLEIEKEGGLLKYQLSGQLKQMLQASHQERIKQQRTMVGVNKFQNADGQQLDLTDKNLNGTYDQIISAELDS